MGVVSHFDLLKTVVHGHPWYVIIFNGMFHIHKILIDRYNFIMIMTGETLDVSPHEIPRRKSVTNDSGKRITKSEDYRRVSITYRTV